MSKLLEMWNKFFFGYDDDEEPQEPSQDEEEHPFKTCAFDPRFPHTNQTRHCFVSFVDFQRCSRLLGNDEGCEQLELCYRSMCPNEWVEKWEEQLEEGTFPVKLPPKKEEEENDEEAEDVKDEGEEPDENGEVEEGAGDNGEEKED